MHKDLAIKVENLSKVYRLYDKSVDRLKELVHPLRKKYHKEFYALNDINFEIKKGETIGIIGKNGSGKSTLLKILSGVVTPTSGKVYVLGRISSLLELGIGFNPEFTGIQNIYLNGTIMGCAKRDIDDKVDEILSFADIGDFAYQPVKMYSSGMFARLAFAVAINVDPDILIIDEALSVGDVAFQSKCYRKFNDFKKAGKTILLVTHSLDSIIKYCDRGIVLDKGIKIEETSAKEAVDIYKRLMVDCYFDQEEKINDEDKKESQKIIWKNGIPVNPNYLEYGNRKAEIIDAGIFDSLNKLSNTLENGEFFEFRIKVRFNETIQEPIFAYVIKDIKGTEITGTNTLIESEVTGVFHKGDIAYVKFKQELNLQNQSYMVSFGCTNYTLEDFEVYHRLYDFFIFQVISNKSTSGVFDPKSQIYIERI